MTQEEKAKAYDEAIERAREQLEGANVFDYKEGQIAHDIRTTTYAIFPELKESEDEKIRKEILDYIDKATGCKRWVAWLEKQGEKKVSYTTLAETGNGGINALVTKELPTNGCNEQKPVNDTDEDIVEAVKDTSILDMVEPKFKVGDIVQYITDSTDRRKIEEVDTLCNMYHTDSSPIMFEIEDEWKVVVNAEDVEQKPAWSEEDEKHIDSLLERLEGMCKKGATFTKTRFAISRDMDWLKSLKDRIGG